MFYCTEPIPDCSNPQFLSANYNASVAKCMFDYHQIVGGRIYLSVGILNAFCIFLTTLLFVYCAKHTPKDLSLKKACLRHKLQQRSVLATIMGAIGHLIFSTTILFAEAFNYTIGCQLVLWGVLIGFYTWMFAFCIRAFRLRFLFELNQMRVKCAKRDKVDKTEYQYYMNRQRNRGFMLALPYVIYSGTLCIIFIVAIPSDMVAITKDDCRIQWGIGLLIGFFAIFICILSPFLLWYLRHTADTHGIRTEIWVHAIIAIPFFILLVVWFGFDRASRPIELYASKTYSPGDWAVYFTVVAHFISVVLPVMQFFLADNKYWNKTVHQVRHLFRPREKRQTCLEDQGSPFIPELSIASLEHAMAHPEILHQLQDLAIRDFSSENVLFYETYLQLLRKCRESITERHSAIHWVKRMSSSSMIHPAWMNSDEFLSAPIPIKLYPDCVALYESFIREDSPAQVNISYRARHMIDQVFLSLYKQQPELDPNAGTTIRKTFSGSSSSHPSEKEQIEQVLVLNLNVFHAAQVEVCWNIFNSVYPKFVEMYNMQK